MDIVGMHSGGANIVGWPYALPRWQPAPSAPAASVDVYWRRVLPTGIVASRWQLLGNFSLYAQVDFPFTPDTDHYVEFSSVSRSADGTPSVSDPEDGVRMSVPFNRETEAPTIGQNKPATADEVEIGITGFTRFARYRRVTISANADMSDPLMVLTYNSSDFAAHELPRHFILSRTVGVLTTEAGSELQTEDGATLLIEDDAAVLPLTVYVTVAHSGGTAWTPDSDILEVTFAAADGTGGSDGNFDPLPRQKESLDQI
jgi:hypothetical protein